MGLKSRWIASTLIVLTIVGLIFSWEQVKPEQPKFVAYFGYTPDELKGKRYNTLEKAFADELKINEYLQQE
ncbi:hypothetical protein [Macrococcoides caseolyticum]|uniref:hypothetical protein n=1 Tax=Macrococcoides caseolyticum TaxID=69966 RepID=UPI001F2CF884|nr:hypothetical protein [Macrococcus caseolyticus]MCE4958000.1 hypothetical protein [Macrococcus caseolyticus]